MDKDNFTLPSGAESAAFFARQSFPLKSCPLPRLIAYSLHLLEASAFDAKTDRHMTRKRALWIARKAEVLGIRDFNWQSFNILLEAAGERSSRLDLCYTRLFIYLLSSVAAENKVFYIKFNKCSALGLPGSGFLRQTALYKACSAFYTKKLLPEAGIAHERFVNAKTDLRKFMAAADSACVQDSGEQFAMDYLGSIDDRLRRGRFAGLLGRICAMSGLHWINPESGEPLSWLELPSSAECRRYFKEAGLPPGTQPRLDMLCSLLMDELGKYGESRSSIGQYAKICRRLCCFAARRGANACSRDLLDAFAADFLGAGNPLPARRWKRNIALRTVRLLKELLARGSLEGFRFTRGGIEFNRPGLEGLRRRYRRHLESGGLKPATLELHDYVLRGALEAAGAECEADLAGLGHADAARIEASFAGRMALSSLGTVVGLLRGLFKWLHAEGVVRRDLSGLFLKPYFVNDYIAPYLTLENQRRLKEYLDSKASLRARAVILLALEQGLRRSDIIKLKRSEIDFRKRELRLVQEKTGVPLVQPLRPEVAEAVKAYIERERPCKLRSRDEPVFLNSRPPFAPMRSVYWAFSAAIAKAGLRSENKKAAGPHLCRYSFVHALLCALTPHSVITGSLGHTSPDSDRPYFALDPERLSLCCLTLESLEIGHSPIVTSGGRHA